VFYGVLVLAIAGDVQGSQEIKRTAVALLSARELSIRAQA